MLLALKWGMSERKKLAGNEKIWSPEKVE